LANLAKLVEFSYSVNLINKMEKIILRYKKIPLCQIQKDKNQPRKDFGTKGDTNRIKLSIEKLGLLRAIDVRRIGENKYVIIDGHRRFLCAEKLGFKEIPCQVHENVNNGDQEILRYEAQNNFRKWKPLERSESLRRIKEAKDITNKELSRYIYSSETDISRSMLLGTQSKKYKGLIKKYSLTDSYIAEFLAFQPKLRKIKNFEIDEIVENIFDRINNKVIKSAKELRKLGKIFLRAKLNEHQLYQYLSDQDMTIEELNKKTEQSGFSLLVEELMQKIAEKKSQGVEFTAQEKKFLSQLDKLLNKIFN